MRFTLIPLRIRAAAALLAILGVALFGYTLVTTASLLGNPDPMLRLELVVSAILIAVAAAAVGVGTGLARLADWARWAAIAAGILVTLVAVALPLATPRGNGSPLAIDPLAVLLGASGLLLVVLLAKPYRTD